jgi:hypothetical protein
MGMDAKKRTVRSLSYEGVTDTFVSVSGRKLLIRLEYRQQRKDGDTGTVRTGGATRHWGGWDGYRGSRAGQVDATLRTTRAAIPQTG